MCWGCWRQCGYPAIDNPVVREAARAIGAVYGHCPVGGNLHVIIDDWNIDDDHVADDPNEPGRFSYQEHAYPEKLAAEQYCLGLLRAMTAEERASALALHDLFWGTPGSRPPLSDEADLQAAIADLEQMVDEGEPADAWKVERLAKLIEAKKASGETAKP